MPRHLALLLLLTATAHAALTPASPHYVGAGAVTDYATRPVWDQGSVLGGDYIENGTPTVVWRAPPGTTTSVTVKDMVYDQTVGASQVSDFRWTWSLSPSLAGATVTRGTSNPAVIIPDPANSELWSYVGNGTANITLTATGAPLYTRTVTTSTQGSGTTRTFTGYAAGSLRRHMSDVVDSDLEGADPVIQLSVFSTRNQTTHTYTRNPALWTTCDLSGVPANSWGGIAIAPDIVLYAAHAHPATGTQIDFLGTDGAVVSRTITAEATAPGYTPYWPDWTLAKLSSALPATVTPAKFLPSNWASYLPDLSDDQHSRLPSIGLNQFREATVQEVYAVGDSSRPYAYTASPVTAQRLSFYRTKITGDSSSPCLLPIGGKPVVVTVWTYGGTGSGTSMTQQRAAIDTAMTTLGSAYTTTTADFSAYATY